MERFFIYYYYLKIIYNYPFLDCFYNNRRKIHLYNFDYS